MTDVVRARIVAIVVLVAVVAATGVVARWLDDLDLGGRPRGGDAEVVDDDGPRGPDDPPVGVPRDAQRATVTWINDGDTLRVRTEPGSGSIPADATYPVRLLNIDAPEVRHPERGRECGGDEATALLTALTPVGSTVWLVADRSDTDRFDRFLRAVFTADGTFVNAAVVEAGLARAVLFPPDDRWYGQVRDLERAARDAGAGIWGALC